MTQPFADNSALVTGAGSGMGAATAILLAERGAAVTLVGRRRAKLDEVADEIHRAGGRPLVHEGDVSDPEDVRRAVEHTVSEFGGLDLAVNNAGADAQWRELSESADFPDAAQDASVESLTLQRNG
jgi:NAD(P)-dependent dehydrogenase (short-subunit alcohol dehydrogenase family)